MGIRGNGIDREGSLIGGNVSGWNVSVSYNDEVGKIPFFFLEGRVQMIGLFWTRDFLRTTGLIVTDR